jgi:hypothetical protein
MSCYSSASSSSSSCLAETKIGKFVLPKGSKAVKATKVSDTKSQPAVVPTTLVPFFPAASDHSDHSVRCDKPDPSDRVYGQFLNTFTFPESNEAVLLQIVQPGASFSFPIVTVDPVGVRYFSEGKTSGLIVPRGDYQFTYKCNPSSEAEVAVVVNGKLPVTSNGFTYTAVKTGPAGPSGSQQINFTAIIKAPKKVNYISIVNYGSTLISLAPIAGTRIGSTSVTTDVIIKRLGEHR